MSIRSKIILTVLCLTALLLSFPTMAEESGHQVDPSVAVLFTNDIHSNYDQDIGYDGLMILIPSATAASTACSSSSLFCISCCHAQEWLCGEDIFFELSFTDSGMTSFVDIV